MSYLRKAPPGAKHGMVGGEVQQEILRLLMMENERSLERHMAHDENISQMYELPRVIEAFDWEEDDDDEIVATAYNAKMEKHEPGLETFDQLKKMTRKERQTHFNQQTFRFNASKVENALSSLKHGDNDDPSKLSASQMKQKVSPFATPQSSTKTTIDKISVFSNPFHANKSNDSEDDDDENTNNTSSKTDEKKKLEEKAKEIITKAYDLDDTKDILQVDGTPLKVDMEAVCVDLSLNRSKAVLNFRGRRFERHELELLSEALRTNTSVKRLILSFCELKSKDVRIVTQFLTTNTSLRVLDLSHNYLTATGAIGMKKNIEKNKTLKVLLLSRNYLSNKGSKVLLDMMKQNGTIEMLALDYNGVDDKALLLEILKASEQNTKGSASNKARSIQEKFDQLKLEHEKLKNEFKNYKKVASNTMFTPQERLKMIMNKNKSKMTRRTGKANWKRLSVVNKLRAGLIKSKSKQQDEANSLNAKIKKGKKKAKKKKLKPL